MTLNLGGAKDHKGIRIRAGYDRIAICNVKENKVFAWGVMPFVFREMFRDSEG